MLNEKMNALLSDYVVLAHKLQTYHWYVKGHAFFATHAQLEELYDEANDNVDEIAEKILMIGGKPAASMAHFLELASIEEAPEELVAVRDVFASVKADYESLLARVKDVKAAAEKEGVDLISAAMDELIAQLSKNIWMLGQALA